MSHSLGFLLWVSTPSLTALRFTPVPEPYRGFPLWKSQRPWLVSEGRSWVRPPALRQVKLLPRQSPADLALTVTVKTAEGSMLMGYLGSCLYVQGDSSGLSRKWLLLREERRRMQAVLTNDYFLEEVCGLLIRIPPALLGKWSPAGEEGIPLRGWERWGCSERRRKSGDGNRDCSEQGVPVLWVGRHMAHCCSLSWVNSLLCLPALEKLPVSDSWGDWDTMVRLQSLECGFSLWPTTHRCMSNL